MFMSKLTNVQKIMETADFNNITEQWTAEDYTKATDLWKRLKEFTVSYCDCIDFDSLKKIRCLSKFYPTSKFWLESIAIFKDCDENTQAIVGEKQLMAVYAILQTGHEKSSRKSDKRSQKLTSTLNKCLYKNNKPKYKISVKNKKFYSFYKWCKKELDLLEVELPADFLYFIERILSNSFIMKTIQANSEKTIDDEVA